MQNPEKERQSRKTWCKRCGREHVWVNAKRVQTETADTVAVRCPCGELMYSKTYQKPVQ